MIGTQKKCFQFLFVKTFPLWLDLYTIHKIVFLKPFSIYALYKVLRHMRHLLNWEKSEDSARKFTLARCKWPSSIRSGSAYAGSIYKQILLTKTNGSKFIALTSRTLRWNVKKIIKPCWFVNEFCSHQSCLSWRIAGIQCLSHRAEEIPSHFSCYTYLHFMIGENPL